MHSNNFYTEYIKAQVYNNKSPNMTLHFLNIWAILAATETVTV